MSEWMDDGILRLTRMYRKVLIRAQFEATSIVTDSSRMTSKDTVLNPIFAALAWRRGREAQMLGAAIMRMRQRRDEWASLRAAVEAREKELEEIKRLAIPAASGRERLELDAAINRSILKGLG